MRAPLSIPGRRGGFLPREPLFRPPVSWPTDVRDGRLREVAARPACARAAVARGCFWVIGGLERFLDWFVTEGICVGLRVRWIFRRAIISGQDMMFSVGNVKLIITGCKRL